MKDVRHSIPALFVLIVLVLASCTEGTTVLVPWSETVTDLSPTDGTALVTVRPTLSWKAVDGAIKYYIQLALDDEDLESAPMTEVLEAAYSLPENLMDGVVYHWRVRAVNATNQLGPWSVVSSLSVGKNWLSGDTVLGVIRNTTDGSVKYQIEISDNREALDGFVQEEDSPIDKKTYYAIFKDADGEDAPWSALYMLNVGWSEDIGGLGITDDAVASLSLQIEYSQLGDVNYLGMLTASRADLEGMAATEASMENQYVLTFFKDTISYWHVREVKEDGLAGSWSKVNTLVLDDILEAVSDLSPEDGSITADTTPALSWSETSGAVGYQVRMADSESGLDNAVPVEEEGEIHHPTTAWDNSHVHYWQVRAKDANGQYGPWSAIHSLEVTWGAIDELSPAAGSSTTDTTPALSWNAVSGATGYEVQIAGSEAGLASAQAVEVSATSYTPSTGLTNNQTHYWRVRAVDGDGQKGDWSAIHSLSLNWGAVSDLSPPDGSIIADTTPALSWNAVPGATGYEVQIAGSEADLASAQSVEVSAASYTPSTGLTNNQTHYWRVRAKDGDGQYGDWSAIHSLSVNWGAVSGLSPDDGATTTDTTPALSWNAVSGATGYEVQIAGSEGGLASAQAVEVSAAGYTPSTALTNNQTHYWRVRAKDGDGQYGDWSAVQSLTVNIGAVSDLSPPDGSTTTDTTPALSWNAVPGATGYEVQIAASEGGLASAQAVEVSAAGYTPSTALTNNQTHYWRVRAKDGDGQYGDWSAVQSLTVNIGAVSDLSPPDGSTTTDTTPALSWNAVPGAAGYEVQIAGSEAGLASAQAVEVSVAGYTPSTGLTNNQTHYWRVRAKDGDGQYGDWSAIHSLSVNWGAVSGLSPSDGSTTTDTTPALSWNAVPGAAGYEVQIAGSEAGLASAQAVEVRVASYTPSTGLTNNQTHYWRVRAKDGDGQSGAWSAINSLSINWGAVSGLSPSDGSTTTDTTPALSWNAVPGAAGYEVQIAGSEAGLASAQAVEVSVASYTPSTGLTNNQTHYWRVRAKDGDGQYGDWSAIHSLSVNWGAVSGLSPFSTTDTTPALSWNAVPGVAGYEVQIAASEAGLASAQAVEVSAASYTPSTALTNNQTHYWRVRAKDGDGQHGAWSAVASISIGYFVGGYGPAGGIVFYDKGSYSDGWRYLEAAKSDQATNVEWGGYGTSVGETSTGIGSGKANTEKIVKALGDGNYTNWDEEVELNGNYAAKICDDLVLGGHDDWFLPSKDELNELRKQRNTVGGFASNYYWSSSEDSAYFAWLQYFDSGAQGDYTKDYALHVRAVRAF